jgi:hypothetical protein
MHASPRADQRRALDQGRRRSAEQHRAAAAQQRRKRGFHQVGAEWHAVDCGDLMQHLDLHAFDRDKVEAG